MRLFISIIATAMFFAASAASAAVTYTVVATASGGDTANMVAGDTLTLDISMRSDADVTGETIFGLGAAVYGYNGALTYVGGITSNASLNTFITGPGTGFGGLSNALGSAPAETPNTGNEIQWFNGLSTDGTDETGANDVSPITDAAGGPVAQLIFTVNASTTFGVGTSADFADAVIGVGGATLGVTNAEVSVTVIPEPGTALLMGLGLAGLAAAGRRE